ncbi:hypothetical protein FIBSPDRAFT_896651 [Athelia psychrophila]|uniref:Uncharacterized protein n=1 Tax=Athelia psychrophila TaxID=1759441 RepID=A0A166D7K3_9AGAM|nr:hypothetical protein FIBSPDRAFT_896651 [Fibularhizoctonia sp. CBS 109695]
MARESRIHPVTSAHTSSALRLVIYDLNVWACRESQSGSYAMSPPVLPLHERFNLQSSTNLAIPLITSHNVDSCRHFPNPKLYTDPSLSSSSQSTVTWTAKTQGCCMRHSESQNSHLTPAGPKCLLIVTNICPLDFDIAAAYLRCYSILALRLTPSRYMPTLSCMSNFVTHNVSAGAEVTNVNGDIYNTAIYIVDTEQLNHIASLLAEARALDRIAARTRFNYGLGVGSFFALGRSVQLQTNTGLHFQGSHCSAHSTYQWDQRHQGNEKVQIVAASGSMYPWYAKDLAARTWDSRTDGWGCTRDGFGRDEEEFGGLRSQSRDRTSGIYFCTYYSIGVLRHKGHELTVELISSTVSLRRIRRRMKALAAKMRTAKIKIPKWTAARKSRERMVARVIVRKTSGRRLKRM